MFVTKVAAQDVDSRVAWDKTKNWTGLKSYEFDQSALIRDRIYFFSDYEGLRYLDLNDMSLTRVDTKPHVTAQYGQKMVHIVERNSLVFIGGYGGRERPAYVQMLRMDTLTRTVVGTLPNVYGHAAEYSPDRHAIVLFGGVDVPDGQAPNSALLLKRMLGGTDINKSNTTRLVSLRDNKSIDVSVLNTKGSPPSARFEHKTAFGEECLYVIGGFGSRDNSRGCRSLHILDLKNSKEGTWSTVETDIHGSTAICWYKSTVVLLGADSFGQSDNHLHVYIPSEQRSVKLRKGRRKKNKQEYIRFISTGKWPYFSHGVSNPYVHNDRILYPNIGVSDFAALTITLT